MCFGSKDQSNEPAPRRHQRTGNQQQGTQLQPITISGPVTPPGQVPAPERDENGLWVQYTQHELTKQNLLAALGYVAQYLRDHGENMTLVAVGGAVNTILLQSRSSTHDVDFFGRLLTHPHLQTLREAGRYAIERSSAPLSNDWLNNATARMPGVVENVDGLLKAAVAQNEVLFSKPGLTVVAAPWNYAFIKKVSRITQGTGRTYDAADAVAYLHRYINSVNSKKPIPFEETQAWGTKYKSLCPIEILQQVNDLYRRTHGANGIIFPKSHGPRTGGRQAGSSTAPRRRR